MTLPLWTTTNLCRIIARRIKSYKCLLYLKERVNITSPGTLNRLYFPRCPSEVPFPSFRSTTYIHHEANYRRSHHIQRPCLSQLHIHLRRLQTRGTGCFMTLQRWSLTYFTMQPRRRQRRCPRVENGLGFVSLNKDSYTLLGKEWIKEHWPYSLYCLTMGKLNCLPNSVSLAISEASRSYRSFWGVQWRCGEWTTTEEESLRWKQLP